MSDDILDSLPAMKGSNKCSNCGSTDWSQARTNKNQDVIMCDKCPGVPSDWDALAEAQ